MSVALVTGSGGLIGSEAVRHFAGLGLDVVGIDNDMRAYFFGAEAPPRGTCARLDRRARRRVHATTTSTSATATASAQLFARYGRTSPWSIHTAAQPSHDWAAREPFTDFDVNAVGTLNLLRGDPPARARRAVHPLLDQQGLRRPAQQPAAGRAGDPVGARRRATRTRSGITRGHVDRRTACTRVFGASKVAADVMVQEYGRYFGMRTAVLPRRHADRPGALRRRAARLPRLRDALRRWSGRTYNVFGYKGKQVRDAIHSPRRGHRVRGVLPRPALRRGLQPRRRPALQHLAHRGVRARRGDHRPRGMVTDYVDAEPGRRPPVVDRQQRPAFQAHYPDWKHDYDVPTILQEIYEANVDKWVPGA